jgi:hypothetical protein
MRRLYCYLICDVHQMIWGELNRADEAGIAQWVVGPARGSDAQVESRSQRFYPESQKPVAPRVSGSTAVGQPELAGWKNGFIPAQADRITFGMVDEANRPSRVRDQNDFLRIIGQRKYSQVFRPGRC